MSLDRRPTFLWEYLSKALHRYLVVFHVFVHKKGLSVAYCLVISDQF
jgi:hypothetical protein